MIKKTKILNIQSYMGDILPGHDVRVAVKLTASMQAKIARWGFSEPPQDGETILPAGRGPSSRFNAEGRWEVHKNLPKEDRYIRTISWSWTDWQGNKYEEFKDINRLCYPRTLISPPAEEITYSKIGSEAYLTSQTFKNVPDDHEAIRSAANVLLEMCGECELVQGNLAKFPSLKMRRVAWKFLPPGKSPWSALSSHLATHIKASPSTMKVILDRQKTIMNYNPDQLYVGEGGFGDYIAYDFKSRGLVVLECVRKGNAIYVFSRNWTSFAKLSKGDIIQHGYHHARIIHSNDWKIRLDAILKISKVA